MESFPVTGVGRCVPLDRHRWSRVATGVCSFAHRQRQAPCSRDPWLWPVQVMKGEPSHLTDPCTPSCCCHCLFRAQLAIAGCLPTAHCFSLVPSLVSFPENGCHCPRLCPRSLCSLDNVMSSHGFSDQWLQNEIDTSSLELGLWLHRHLKLNPFEQNQDTPTPEAAPPQVFVSVTVAKIRVLMISPALIQALGMLYLV